MAVRFHLSTLLIVIAIIAVLLSPALPLMVLFVLLALIVAPYIVLMLFSTTALVRRERRSRREISTTWKVANRLGVMTLIAALTIWFIWLVVPFLTD